MDRVLLDTGPLVAILSAKDDYHRTCVDQLRSLRPPLITCWPVITEAAWLLRRDSVALQRLLTDPEESFFRITSIDDGLPWIARFLRRYQKLEAQLADASLVYLAERHGIDTVFTLDRRDFSIYRFARSRSLRLLPVQ